MIKFDFSSNNSITENVMSANSSALRINIGSGYNIFLNNNITATNSHIIEDSSDTGYDNYLIYNNSDGQISWLNTSNLTIIENGPSIASEL